MLTAYEAAADEDVRHSVLAGHCRQVCLDLVGVRHQVDLCSSEPDIGLPMAEAMCLAWMQNIFQHCCMLVTTTPLDSAALPH